MTRRRKLFLAAAVLLLVGAVAHAWYWYAPRVRAGTPNPDDLPGRLLAQSAGAGSELPYAVWVAYPHQNLGALEAGLGSADERREFLAATARLAELPAIELPRFGPFAAPPARELAVVSDLAGERVVVAARVYPLLAAVARLAGKLAGNPWLAGGEVEAFGGRATVSWDGTLWTVGNVAPPEPVAAPGLPADEAPLLAAVRLAEPVSYLPAGLHRLRVADGGLRIESAGAVRLAADLETLASADAALFAVSGRGGPLERRAAADGGAGEEAGSTASGGAFALFSEATRGEGLAALLGNLPGAAVWFEPGGLRFELPAEEILGRSRGEEAAGDGWSLVATGGDALDRAEPLTAVVERLSREVSVGLVVEPEAALAVVDQVVGVLERVPLTSRRETRKWRDWHTVLSPLGRYGRVEMVVDEGELVVRLM